MPSSSKELILIKDWGRSTRSSIHQNVLRYFDSLRVRDRCEALKAMRGRVLFCNTSTYISCRSASHKLPFFHHFTVGCQQYDMIMRHTVTPFCRCVLTSPIFCMALEMWLLEIKTDGQQQKFRMRLQFKKTGWCANANSVCFNEGSNMFVLPR